MIGLDAVGQRYSTFLDDNVAQVQQEGCKHPVTSASIIILNNTTPMMDSMSVGPSLRKKIIAARDLATLKFLQADTLEDGTAVMGIRCQALFTDDSLTRSPDREGKRDFFMLLNSKTQDGTGEPVNMFCMSKLWRRNGPVMERVERT